MISWFSMKYSYVALSIAESEYVASCSTSCEVVWLRKLLSDLFDLELDVNYIYCDNHICVKFSENSVFHDKSKHILRYVRGTVDYGLTYDMNQKINLEGYVDSY